MRNIDEDGARTNQCLSLFSVTTLLVLAFILFRFANNKFLYEYDDCIYLRNCSYVVCCIFIIIVICIGAMIQYQDKIETKTQLFIFGLLFIVFTLCILSLAIYFFHFEPCGMLHTLIKWILSGMVIFYVIVFAIIILVFWRK